MRILARWIEELVTNTYTKYQVRHAIKTGCPVYDKNHKYHIRALDKGRKWVVG